MRNNSIVRILLGLLVLPIFDSCTKWSVEELVIDSPVSADLKNRINQITEISWTPHGEIPKQNGYFRGGETVTGIPYSSVKEEEKFVGQYISFYTFATAVKNHKSVLYTENVKEAPYHGTNCSTYYGTVCSMAVNYVLGLPYSYTTSHYKQLDSFIMVTPQTIDAAEPGDILLQDSKHVVMIVSLSKKKESVESVFILESSGTRGTRIDRYSRRELLNRWERDGWELLRYRDLDKLKYVDAMAFNDYPYDTPFNSPLCCSRGDRACFREGEQIVINNLDGRPHTFDVVSDNIVIDTGFSDGSDIATSTLAPGVYTFDLSTSGWTNPSVEVLETSVSAERQGDQLTVTFSSSNGKPMSIIISNISGNHYLVRPITEEEREMGFTTVTIPNRSGQKYLKVMFEGKYGSVMNEPLAI